MGAAHFAFDELGGLQHFVGGEAAAKHHGGIEKTVDRGETDGSGVVKG